MPEAVGLMAEGHGCSTHYTGNVKVTHFPIILCRLISEDEDKSLPYYSSQCSPPASIFFFFKEFYCERGGRVWSPEKVFMTMVVIITIIVHDHRTTIYCAVNTHQVRAKCSPGAILLQLSANL